jgi:hypothetical protein
MNFPKYQQHQEKVRTLEKLLRRANLMQDRKMYVEVDGQQVLKTAEEITKMIDHEAAEARAALHAI